VTGKATAKTGASAGVVLPLLVPWRGACRPVRARLVAARAQSLEGKADSANWTASSPPATNLPLGRALDDSIRQKTNSVSRISAEFRPGEEGAGSHQRLVVAPRCESVPLLGIRSGALTGGSIVSWSIAGFRA